MKLKISSAVLLAVASSIPNSDAFLPPIMSRARVAVAPKHILHVGGWDNDDFLNALSAPKEGDENNDEENDEEGQGGSRFKKMMEASKQRAQAEAHRPVTPIENPFLAPPPAPAPPSIEGLTVEQQAELFRQMMQQQQQVQPPLPTRQKTDLRPVGRNRDADAITNTSDLYFAQLKRDSSVRNIARIRGDNDKANAVFKDEGISQLEQLLQSNPHLKEARERERSLLETAPEEMLLPYEVDEHDKNKQLSYSGISYKEKLMQRRSKAGKAPPAPAPAQASVTSTNPATSSSDSAAAATIEPTNKMPQQWTQVEEPAMPAPVQNKPEVPETASTTAATVAPPPAAASVVPSVPSPPAATVPETSESEAKSAVEIRQEVRTLMGLLIKHRGGPGFGAGRLKGAEVERFEKLLGNTSALLRDEAYKSLGQDPPPPSSMTQPPAQTQMNVPPPPQPQQQYQQQQQFTTSAPLLEPGLVVSSANKPATQQLDNMIACIEGAIQMYKNSPPELKGSVLSALRAALASSIDTCDRVIHGNVAPQYSSYQSADISAPAAVAASSVYEVGHLEPEQAQQEVPQTPEPAAPQTPMSGIGMDSNSKTLENIYNQLKAAAGNGKLGLRDDLSAAEADELADSIVELRDLLMDELETGIPEPEPVTASSQPQQQGGSVTSKYQEMLAKAKAAKNNA